MAYKKKMIKKQKRFAPKVHVKKGDTVLVLSGASKGVKAEVLEVYPQKAKALVKGVNVVTKHIKPNTNEDFPDGGRQKKEAPIPLSKLMVVDPKSGEPTRIGRKLDDKGKLKRYSKKTQEFID